MHMVEAGETVKPSFTARFRCRTRYCVEKVFKALGMDIERVEREAEETIRPDAVFVFTDVTDYLCEDSCSASLVSLSASHVVVGEAEEVDSMIGERYCGPDIQEVVCRKYRLQPGTVIYHYERGYTGDRSEDRDVVYINPPPGYSVRVEDGRLIVDKDGGHTVR